MRTTADGRHRSSSSSALPKPSCTTDRVDRGRLRCASEADAATHQPDGEKTGIRRTWDIDTGLYFSKRGEKEITMRDRTS